MRDLTTRQLWNAVSGVLADSKDERAEEATRAVNELRRRCDVGEALLGCAVEVARFVLIATDECGEGARRLQMNRAVGRLASNPRALMDEVPEIKDIIESALAQRGVGLEELE